jgi:hypothetical protein
MFHKNYRKDKMLNVLFQIVKAVRRPPGRLFGLISSVLSFFKFQFSDLLLCQVRIFFMFPDWNSDEMYF